MQKIFQTPTKAEYISDNVGSYCGFNVEYSKYCTWNLAPYAKDCTPTLAIIGKSSQQNVNEKIGTDNGKCTW